MMSENSSRDRRGWVTFLISYFLTYSAYGHGPTIHKSSINPWFVTKVAEAYLSCHVHDPNS